MSDMNAVIVPKSDQISADDLITGEITIKINRVVVAPGQEQPVSMFFDGSDRAFRPCKSMSRVIVAAWGSDSANFVGRSMTLYRDPTVKWGGLQVGGVRISAMSHMARDMTLALTETKGKRKPYTVTVLKAPGEQAKPTVAAATVAPDDTLKAAREAAGRGKDAFTVWWNAVPKEARDVARTIMPELQKMTIDADAEKDPFGLPEVTQQQLEAAEAEALAAIQSQNAAE